MAPSNTKAVNEPLLGGQPSTFNDGSSPPSLSSTTQTAIRTLSFLRIAAGAACLIAPRFTCNLFLYNVPAEQTVLVRMFAARDAVLGDLLLTAEDKGREDGGRREIRRAIWAGMAADVVDIGSLAFAVAMGHIGKPTGGLLGVFAVGAIGLGALGLRGL